MQTKAIMLWLVIGLVLLAAFSPAKANETGQININTASAEELMQLRGVGEVTARKIIEFREQQGEFATPEDLMKVPGIGPKTFDRNRERISVE